MMIIALLLMAQNIPTPPPGYTVDKRNPFDDLVPKSAGRLGPGPHTLIIIGVRENTKIEYKTGPACQRAKDAILAQAGPRQLPNGGLVYSTVTVLCVPR